MNRISNIDSIPREYMYDPDFQSAMKTVLVGDAVGSEKIYRPPVYKQWFGNIADP